MNFEAVIGLEIHVELKTKSKMFSSAPNVYGALPNSQVALLDMAFPGTLPTVNQEAVRYAIRVANALHMQIDDELHFDRKNYFYSDLPKGYQITQNERPIGKEGYLEIETDDGLKQIAIERLHIEEDTCKQLHFSDYSLLDYNRAGVPLIEIVSKPVMNSGLEAMKYVEKIRSIVTFSEVSDGKMEEGSLRCDVNISLRPYGAKEFGTKVEIKNINSISYIQKAIDFEMLRQAKILLSGGLIAQETRRYDEMKKETILMRVKTDAVDYKYFAEPNIIPIKLSKEFVQDAIMSCPELKDDLIKRFSKQYQLSKYDISLLTMNKDIAYYYDECAKYSSNYKAIANWINVDINTVLNKSNSSIKDFNITPKMLCDLIKMIDSKEINNSQAREIFAYMVNQGVDALTAKKALGITSQILDTDFIGRLVKEVINEFPESVIDFKNGKDRALGFMVGKVMAKSKGKANPKIASDMLLEEIKNS